ncbi:MAG: riboflavin kinase, partial [Chthoniobacterales bacterium]
RYLRPEKKFADLDQLAAQIACDVAQAKSST